MNINFDGTISLLLTEHYDEIKIGFSCEHDVFKVQVIVITNEIDEPIMWLNVDKITSNSLSMMCGYHDVFWKNEVIDNVVPKSINMLTIRPNNCVDSMFELNGTKFGINNEKVISLFLNNKYKIYIGCPDCLKGIKFPLKNVNVTSITDGNDNKINYQATSGPLKKSVLVYDVVPPPNYDINGEFHVAYVLDDSNYDGRYITDFTNYIDDIEEKTNGNYYVFVNKSYQTYNDNLRILTNRGVSKSKIVGVNVPECRLVDRIMKNNALHDIHRKRIMAWYNAWFLKINNPLYGPNGVRWYIDIDCWLLRHIHEYDVEYMMMIAKRKICNLFIGLNLTLDDLATTIAPMFDIDIESKTFKKYQYAAAASILWNVNEARSKGTCEEIWEIAVENMSKSIGKNEILSIQTGFNLAEQTAFNMWGAINKETFIVDDRYGSVSEWKYTKDMLIYHSNTVPEELLKK